MRLAKIVPLLLSCFLTLSITLHAATDEEWKAEGRFSFIVKDDNTIEITDYNDYWNLGYPSPEVIDFPDKINEFLVTSIGDANNSGPLSLQKIRIPGSIKKVGKMAFSGCERLDTVILEEGVEEIGAFAFAGCASLRELYLPASIKIIGDNPFLNCGEIYEMNRFSYEFTLSLSELNESFSLYDDLLICNENRQLIYCAQSRQGTVVLDSRRPAVRCGLDGHL